MMEKLGEPQTHLALKEMIKAIDEDNDGEISFREVCVTCTSKRLQINLLLYILAYSSC